MTTTSTTNGAAKRPVATMPAVVVRVSIGRLKNRAVHNVGLAPCRGRGFVQNVIAGTETWNVR